MAIIYKTVTITAQGSTSGPLYDIFYSADGVTYTLCVDGNNVSLPTVGSSVVVSVEDTANFIKAVNLHPGCEGNDVIVNFGGLTTTTTTSGPTTTTTTTPGSTTTTTGAPTTTTTTLAVNCYIYSWACDNEYGVPCSLSWTNCDGTPGSDFVSNGSSGTQCARQGTFGISNASFPTEGASCNPTTTTTTSTTSTTTTAAPTTTTTTAAPTYVSGAAVIYDFGNGSYGGSGSEVYDLSGNAVTASMFNTPTWYPSTNGGVMYFDRTASEYMTYSGKFNSAFTIQCVFSLTGGTTPAYPIFGGQKDNNGASLGVDTGFSGNDGLQAEMWYGASGNTGTGTFIDVAAGIDITNKFVMYTFTSNGSNSHKYYVNTSLATTNTSTRDRTLYTPTNQTVYIMTDPVDTSKYVTGYLMGWLVYPRELNSTEITTNYNLFSSRF